MRDRSMAYRHSGTRAGDRRQPETRRSRRRRADTLALAALALALGALLFWLAYRAVGEPAVALIIALVTMLPVASLIAASFASGPARR